MRPKLSRHSRDNPCCSNQIIALRAPAKAAPCIAFKPALSSAAKTSAPAAARSFKIGNISESSLLSRAEINATAGNAASAHGTDQRRGLGEVAGVAQGNAADQRTDGKPGSGLSVSSAGVQADDDGGGAGADGGVQEGYREADQGSRRTGWESERESLSDYLAANRPGRGNLVAKAGTDRHSDNLSLALMGARGAGHLMSLFEDSTEETEEERKERQAQNAAAAAGLAIGAAVALAQRALQKDEPIDENPNDDEGWGFNLSM